MNRKILINDELIQKTKQLLIENQKLTKEQKNLLISKLINKLIDNKNVEILNFLNEILNEKLFEKHNLIIQSFIQNINILLKNCMNNMYETLQHLHYF